MDAIERASADSEGEEAALLDNFGDEQPLPTSSDGTLEAIRGMENKMVDTLQNFAETLTTSLNDVHVVRRMMKAVRRQILMAHLPKGKMNHNPGQNY